MVYEKEIKIVSSLFLVILLLMYFFNLSDFWGYVKVIAVFLGILIFLGMLRDSDRYIEETEKKQQELARRKTIREEKQEQKRTQQLLRKETERKEKSLWKKFKVIRTEKMKEKGYLLHGNRFALSIEKFSDKLRTEEEFSGYYMKCNDCHYEWKVKKDIGLPARCVKCGSKMIDLNDTRNYENYLINLPSYGEDISKQVKRVNKNQELFLEIPCIICDHVFEQKYKSEIFDKHSSKMETVCPVCGTLLCVYPNYANWQKWKPDTDNLLVGHDYEREEEWALLEK